jgi:hypothetical protein
LYRKAVDLRDRFEHKPKFVHVRREQNFRADQLCNEVLDGERLSTPLLPTPAPAAPKPAAKLPAPKAPPPPPRLTPRERVVACLAEAAAAWAKGNANDPPPEEVWERLRRVLDEEGFLRRPGERG